MNKVIFVGTTDFGIPTLEMLKKNYDLCLVITQPDRPAGRKKVLTPPPIKTWAVSNDVKVLQPEKIIEVANIINDLQPDVVIVAAYGQIIPNSILQIPLKGTINLHTSLLPKYRGASPIQSAILNGEKETGITIMLMDEKMDHGPIIATEKIAIEDPDTYVKLNDKLSQLAAAKLAEILPDWIAGNLIPQEQNHSEASYVKTLHRDDAKIDWTQPARQIYKKIKALNPEPGTWTTLDKKSVKIIDAEEVKNGRIELPGKIYLDGRDCLVKCGDYSLKLLKVQPEGKNPITGSDYINGLKKLETKVFV